MSDSSPRVRKDLARNRVALLHAAEEAMATGGLSVPADLIAADAGVSIATLYRHFPDRESLILAVQQRVFDEWNVLLGEACEHERAWDGLVWLFGQLAERAATRPHFSEIARRLIARGHPGSERWTSAWDVLLSAARAQGDLRPDATDSDVAALMIGHVMVVSAFEPLEPGMRHRHLGLLLDAMRGPGDRG